MTDKQNFCWQPSSLMNSAKGLYGWKNEGRAFARPSWQRPYVLKTGSLPVERVISEQRCKDSSFAKQSAFHVLKIHNTGKFKRTTQL